MSKDKVINLAEMSDEEILNLDPSTLPEKDPEKDDEEDEDSPKDSDKDPEGDEPGDDDDKEDNDSDDTDGADSDNDSSDDEDDEAGTASADEEDGDGNEDEDSDDSENDDEDDQSSDDNSKDGESDDSTDSTDYKAEFAKLLAPFKAAKREIKVETPEDARRLMQMGVDYSRKMEAMKPYQRVLKTLERNDLLNIEDVNFLIDLHKGNPEAIKKLLRDSKTDPVDIDLEDNKEYKPTDHTVGDKELAVDLVIDDIRGSDSFDKTVKIITDDWDKASRTLLLDNPSVIRVINDHVDAGIYDQIADRLANERVFGKHQGLSDLVAYQAVGDAMQAEGAFGPTPAATSARTTTTQDEQDLNGSEESEADKKRKARRKAANPTRGGAATRKKKAPDFGKMTDEQIEAFDINTL